MCPNTNLKALIECLVSGFFQQGLFPLITGLAVVMFLWGVFKFVRDSGDETARTEGKKFIFWGLVGIVVMLCVWAFVEILTGGSASIPQISPSS